MSDFHDNLVLLDAMSFYAVDPTDPDSKKSSDTAFAARLRRELAQEYDTLRAERDALVAVIRSAVESLDLPGESYTGEEREAIRRLREAINAPAVGDKVGLS